MTIHEVAALLPKELCSGVVDGQRGDGQPFMETPFFSRGCGVIVTVESDGGRLYLSDHGTVTVAAWHGRQREFAGDSYAEFARSVCLHHDVVARDDGTFWREFTPATVLEAYFDLCSAVIELGAVQSLPETVNAPAVDPTPEDSARFTAWLRDGATSDPAQALPDGPARWAADLIRGSGARVLPQLPAFALAAEKAVYDELLPHLLADGDAGRWLVVVGGYRPMLRPTEAEAFDAGYRLAGTTPFLVRQVLAEQRVERV